MNLAELAEEALQRLGERKSLIFEGKELTNAEIQADARRCHRALAGLGLRTGHVVALCMVNDPLSFSMCCALSLVSWRAPRR